MNIKQNGVVRNVKTISEEKTSLVSSYNNEPQIKVVEAIEHVQSEQVRYFGNTNLKIMKVFSIQVLSYFNFYNHAR